MKQKYDKIDRVEIANSSEWLERRLLNDFQQHFPLTPTPYTTMAKELGVSEEKVIGCLKDLSKQNKISRIGPVFYPNSIGVSTLAAMAVPTEQLQSIANFVNVYQEVNHNYEREHKYNLWFVVTAANTMLLSKVLDEIEAYAQIPVMRLPMVEDYHINLGFELKWS